jgi:endoglucanase
MRIQTYSLPFILSLVLAVMLSGVAPFGAMAESTPTNVWWPSNGVHITGTQPFKAQVQGADIANYEMFWQVDGGTWNWMDNNTTDAPHKEAHVDVTNWNWHGSGPYAVNFIARQNGSIISQQSVQVYIDNGQPIVLPSEQVTAKAAEKPAPLQVNVSAPAAIVAATQNTAPSVSVAPAQSVFQIVSQTQSNAGNLYVNPNSSAASNASSVSGTDGDMLRMLASQPTATWFGNWNSDIYNDVHKVVAAAASQNATPVLVAYNIPARDCGGYSSGGSNSVSGYQSWIGSFASAIGSSKAIVVLEPDALAQLSCLSQADQATRLSLLSGAVATLKANPNTKVYVDAGHASWVSADAMAASLQKANVSQADGFALNVSNFDNNDNEVSYGQQISGKVGGKHFVVDTSRNGKGSSGEWCNPSGRAIGQKPTTQTGNSMIDAFLWVKTPGESDGNCNGGPGAGVWWTSYALNLVKNAH